MSIWELILLAVGLSMDACAVSICKGLALKKVNFRNMLVVGLWFGGFQALMPMLGYLLGTTFAKYIESIDHWIAFILLLLIGGNMIREAIFDRGAEETGEADASLAPLSMLVLAVATSIDALAVGITFSTLIADIPHLIFAVASIGVITCALSCVGVKLGTLFGARFKSKAEILGGVILVLLGVKILLEHLGVISF